MDFESFEDVIKFAIEKERDAVAFMKPPVGRRPMPGLKRPLKNSPMRKESISPCWKGLSKGSSKSQITSSNGSLI